jgi:hypothetical protein
VPTLGSALDICFASPGSLTSSCKQLVVLRMRNEFAVDSRKLPERLVDHQSAHGDADVVLPCQIRTQKSESAQDIEQEPLGAPPIALMRH